MEPHDIIAAMAAERARHLKAMATCAASLRECGVILPPFAYKYYSDIVMDAESDFTGAAKTAIQKLEDDAANSGDGFRKYVTADRRDYMAYRG